MQLLPLAEGGNPPPFPGFLPGSPSAGTEARALLSWWQAAGVDTLVADAPRPWLKASNAEQAKPEESIAPPLPVAARMVPPAAKPMAHPPFVPTATTLAGLLAEVRSQFPLAPIADGNPASGVMILGEAPSAEDLRTGRPFTGPTGILLDQMLAAIGLDRTSCYISLLVPRRRIPGTPPPEAILQDLALTQAHIRLAAPRFILLLGAAATQALSSETAAISALRGHWLNLPVGETTVPALPTFNPAYLLRRPEAKREAWADLLEFKHRMSA